MAVPKQRVAGPMQHVFRIKNSQNEPVFASSHTRLCQWFRQKASNCRLRYDEGEDVPAHDMKTCGSGGIAPLVHNLGTRWRSVVGFTPRTLHPGPEPLLLMKRWRGGPQNRSGLKKGGSVGPRTGLDFRRHSSNCRDLNRRLVTTPTELPGTL